MAIGTISAIGYFMPIFAFLLVFIVAYILFKKTHILGEAKLLMFIASLILSILFVVGVILINFSKFSSVWFSKGVIGLFLLSLALIFIPWKRNWNFFGKKNWFSWILIFLVILFFVLSSAYIFNWVVSMGFINKWISSSWFGIILLLVIVIVINWKLKK